MALPFCFYTFLLLFSLLSRKCHCGSVVAGSFRQNCVQTLFISSLKKTLKFKSSFQPTAAPSVSLSLFNARQMQSHSGCCCCVTAQPSFLENLISFLLLCVFFLLFYFPLSCFSSAALLSPSNFLSPSLSLFVFLWLCLSTLVEIRGQAVQLGIGTLFPFVFKVYSLHGHSALEVEEQAFKSFT